MAGVVRTQGRELCVEWTPRKDTKATGRGHTGTQRSLHTWQVAHVAFCARGGKTEYL